MRVVLFTAVLLVLGCHAGRRGARAAVPGYLDFDNLPDTNFSCEGKVIGGYYADVETGCQMFHVCTIGQKGEITDIKFLCLNGTVFDQETRVCERVDEVDCSKTEGFYGLNLELYGNTGATYGLEEPEAREDHEESQSHPSHAQSSSPPSTSPTPPTTPKSTSPPTTLTTVISTTSPTLPSTTPAHPFTPPTTISSISSTLHSFNQKPHTVHFSSTSSPHSVSSSFLTFPSGGDQLFETAPEGSGNQSPDLHHISPPSSSSSSWPQVNLQSGGGSGIIHQTDSSPFHALKTTPKPVSIFGTSGHNNDHSNRQFIFSTTKTPSHFFSAKSPGGFSVTSHPPITPFPLKNPEHLIQTNIPPDFYHDQQNRNHQSQKNSPNFFGHQSNVHIIPNPIHFQYTGRPTHQHQDFTTPSIQSTVISSTSSVSSVKTTIKHKDNTQNPPANVNSFAFGINSGLSPTSFLDEKSVSNDTKHLVTPPASYDEYHERDVALDPFFKDVPRISLKQSRSNRRKRQIQGNIQRSRGSHRFINKPCSQPVNQHENQNTPTYKRQPHQSSRNGQNSAHMTPTFNSDALQEQNVNIHTTHITQRIPPQRKSHFSMQAPETSLNRDLAVQEYQVQQSGTKNHRGKQRQTTANLKTEVTEPPLLGSSTELLTTTGQSLPETSFNCEKKVVGGYYADPETDCQVFHICVLGRHGKIRDDKFLCGPGTRFDQKSRTCQAKHLVNCNLATSLYHVNLPYLFPEDNVPVPDVMFESHKIAKRATRKGAPSSIQDRGSLTDSLDDPPITDFRCEDKSQEGLYADVETNCKYFHLCQKNTKGHLYLVSTFECPSGTAFNQYESNCDTSEDIDCAIYSRPEHTFAKSKYRNKRNLVTDTKNRIKLKMILFQENRYKRNVDEESTEIYFADDHIQSAEEDDHSNTNYGNFSEDELYNSSFKVTHTEASEIPQEDGKTHKKLEHRKHEKQKSSAAFTSEHNDEVSHENKEVEISEEDETVDNQSQESSQEEESYETSNGNRSDNNYSHESDETEEKVTEEESSKKDTGDEMYQEYDEESSYEKDYSKPVKSDENIEDDSSESISLEDRNGNVSSSRHVHSKLQQNSKTNVRDKSVGIPKANTEVNPGNLNENNTSHRKENETGEIPSAISSHSVHLSRKNLTVAAIQEREASERSNTQFHKDSKSHKIKIHNEEDENLSIDSTMDNERKPSFLRNESGDTFKSKVNKLLIKLNASVEDISSIHLNTTNEDYYDYYTDEESLLELEELKEKKLSADTSVKYKQNDSSKESNISELEQFREHILAEDILAMTTETSQEYPEVHLHDIIQDPGKVTSQKPAIVANDDSSVTSQNKRISSQNAYVISERTQVLESLTTSTLNEISTSTTTNINLDYKTTEKELEKSNSKHQNSSVNVPNNTSIYNYSLSNVMDQYEMSTEYWKKITDNSSDILEPVSIKNVPMLDSVSMHITENVSKITENLNNETSTIYTTLPTPTKYNFDYRDETTVTEISVCNEDCDTTTELLMTTLSLDISTESSTASNLLHPYKSRPVYRTWRTTTSPPPISIRPNSSLRLPRPSIRHETSKGNLHTASKPVNNTEKVNIRSNMKNNQILGQENSRKDHEIRIKELPNSLKDESVKSAHKTSTEKATSFNTSVTQQMLDEISPTITTLPNIILTVNSPTTITLQNQEQITYSESTSENSGKTVSYTSLEDYRRVNYDGTIPSSVLPTFSRKTFFIDREYDEVTKAGLTTISTSATMTEFQARTETIHETEASMDESYSFTSAQTPHTYYQNGKLDSETFTCTGKKLHQYLPDPFDCHIFHYCSAGFHSRQLLDFRFMCDKGTAFSPVSHHCENEDVSLCGNLHT